jgi:hypothetical protein
MDLLPLSNEVMRACAFVTDCRWVAGYSFIVPEAGTYSAAATFTPTDTTNYLSVSGSVGVTVLSSSEPFDTWASGGSGVTFGGDANNDGIAEGLAWC